MKIIICKPGKLPEQKTVRQMLTLEEVEKTKALRRAGTQSGAENKSTCEQVNHSIA